MCPDQIKKPNGEGAPFFIFPGRFCKIPIFGGNKSGVVRGGFLFKKIHVDVVLYMLYKIVTPNVGSRWSASRAFYIWPHIYLFMVTGNGKAIPKEAKVTTATSCKRAQKGWW